MDDCLSEPDIGETVEVEVRIALHLKKVDVYFNDRLAASLKNL